jgi:glucose/arabinose dehydrogenase
VPLKWIAFVVSLGAFTAVACNDSEPKESDNTPSTSQSNNSVTYVPTGTQGSRRLDIRSYYLETCAKCHGNNAEGGGGGTLSLNTKEKFDQKYDKPFYDAIQKGVPERGMEAYDNLSDAEIWGLVVYIRELQAKALRSEFGSPTAKDGVFKGQRADYKLETVVDTESGLKTPWGIDWLPDGRYLVTSRTGKMHLFDKNGKGQEVANVPASVEMNQGGLMDVAVHPDYAKNGWIYLAVNDPKDSRSAMTKIVRGKLTFPNGVPTWGSTQDILKLPDETYTSSGIHFGCRIAFDGKGHVFIAIGSRGNEDQPQLITSPYGKIYRLMDDGKIPTDNPFKENSGVLGGVWSYGHRNPQGLAFGTDGKLYETEHAPRGGDELNEILKGENYGWNIISYGINYNGTPHAVPWPTKDQKFRMPIFRWLPSIGASGLDSVKGNAFPQWKGDLVAGGLVGNVVDRIRVKDGKLVEREELIHGMGRVRDVACGPDGNIYIVFNQPDKVMRLVPAK